jgi:hypothetical protein
MLSVFEFLDEFSGRLRGAGVRFAITSGMACVRYGLQQTTKDSDWIVEPYDLKIEAAIRAGRMIWESVNRERYRLYQREWKAFYRRWQSEPEWHRPTVEPFAQQHARLMSAAGRYELPCDPFAAAGSRNELFQRGLERASVLANRKPSDMLALAPPITEILP